MEDLSILTLGVEASGVYAFVEEINMCLNTRPYESILDLNAGRANGEYLIGETSLTADRVIDVLKDDIHRNCNGANDYAYTIDVRFYRGSARDIIDVTISIRDNDGATITTTHEFR